jgi:hypothetical protein
MHDSGNLEITGRPARRLPQILPWLAAAGALLAAAPLAATVTITLQNPIEGDTLASPIAIVANASTDAAGAQVTGWQVYLDGVSAFGTPGPASVLNTRLTMANGDHELLVFAWDSTGDYGSTSLTVTAGTCSGFTVSLDSPAGGSEPTPVHFTASAASCHRITRISLYADDTRIFNQAGPRSVDTTVDLPAGNHTVQARAWDSTGSSAASAAISIDVEAAAPPPAAARPARPATPPPAAAPAPPPAAATPAPPPGDPGR